MPVYQYDGKHYELPDGLTDEQAVSKIKAHLGQSPSFMDQVGEKFKEAAGTMPGMASDLMNMLQGRPDKLSEPSKAPVEALGHMVTGLAAPVAGIIGGGVKTGIEAVMPDTDANGNPVEKPGFQKNFETVSNKVATPPKTELGQDLAKPFDELMYRAGPAMLGHMVQPIPPTIPDVPLRTPKPKAAKPKGANVEGALEDLFKADTPPADSPDAFQRGVVDQLSPKQPTIEQRGGNRMSEDGLQQPIPNYEPMLPPEDVNSFGNMADQLQQRQARQAQEADVNARWQVMMRQKEAEALRNRPAPEAPDTAGQQAFNDMVPQLTHPEAVDFPSNNGIGDVANTLRQEAARREQQGMYQDLSRQANAQAQHGQAFDQMMSREGEAGAMRAQQDAQAGGVEMQGLEQMRQQELRTQEVAKQRAQLEQAQRQAEAVANDPRVVKSEERLTKAQELYTKVAMSLEEGRVSEKHMKRIERDLKALEDSHEMLKQRVASEQRLEAFKKSPISSNTRMGRQRGAVSPNIFKEGFEKVKELANGVKLRASSDGRVFSIHANRGGTDLGKVDFVLPRPNEPLKADWTHVSPEARGQGIATEMYKFASELGNDIAASKQQSPEAKAMWDSFEKKGLSKDYQIKTRQPSEAETSLKSILREDARTHLGRMFGGPISSTGPYSRQRGAILLEGKKQKALENLTDKLKIETKLKEISPSQWTPQEAIENIKKAQDIPSDLASRFINNFTKGGIYLAQKTHNPLIRYVVEQFMSSDRLARAETRDWVHGEYAPKIRAVDGKGKTELWQIISAADLNQRDIDLAKLAERGFSEKQLELVQSHQRSMDRAMEAVNNARKDMGLDPVDRRTAYAAMQSTGDFRALVRKEQGGEIVGIISSNFKPRLNRLRGEMEGKGFYVDKERYFGGMPRERGSANDAFIHAIEVLAEKDPKVAEFVEVMNQIRTSEINNFLNMKRHTMEKKGIDGMSGRKSWLDAEQNAKDGFQTQLNYLEAALKWEQRAKAVKNVKEVLDSPETKHMEYARELSERYMYNALGFNPSEIGRNVENAVANVFKSMGIGYSIGRTTMAQARYWTNSLLLTMRPSFWYQNLVQPFQTMPGMKAMLIARGLDAGFDFGTGYTYIFDGASTAIRIRSGEGLNAFDKAAAEYARKNYVYGSDMVEHSNRIGKDAGYYMDQVNNFFAGNVESATRQVMFYSLAHMLRENGMSVQNGLFDAAHNLLDMAMNNYSQLERPQVYNTLGPVGDLAVNLQSYKHNELSRVALFVRDVKENKSMRPIAADMLTRFALGGILGLVAYDEVDNLFRLATKYIAKKPQSLTNIVYGASEGVGKMVYDATGGKVDSPYLVSNGIHSLLGLDMSRSLGLTDVVPDNLGEAMFPGGGKVADIVGAGVDLAKNPTEMNAKRFGYAASPLATQGALDNAWFTKGKGDSRVAVRPRDLKAQAHRSDADALKRSLTFRGINESVERQKTYNVERINTDYADLRQSPLHNMRDALYATGSLRPKDVKAYVEARGNLTTLQNDIRRYAREQQLTPQQQAYMHAQASSAIGALMKAQDYAKAFKK